jgi:ABC-2 type transport system ATP-binding protein
MLTGSSLASSQGGSTDPDSVIQFENVSVRYRIPREQLSGIKEFAIRWIQRRIQYQDFWALREVSFNIRAGEVFGIIGHNGAGKSTMLKVMAQVLKPVEGRVVMRGHIAPLLELGGGFHPELTGRENVFMNMALLGRSRKTTGELFNAIVEFADLSDFIDAPLRTYSTGMVARLGFAVATCIRPDILLVDEILSVGDSQFQQKCLDRMYSFNRQGTTIVIVSHGLGALETLCKRALMLEKGHVKLIGPVDQVIQGYIAEDKLAAPEIQAASPVEAISPPEPKPMPVPEPIGEFVNLSEMGGIYPAENILESAQGTVLVWLKIKSESSPKDGIIFHTDDSRYVLYISLQYSGSHQRYIRKLVARAGGNRRVIDTYYGTSDFPEVGVVIEEDDTPKKYILNKDEWYLAAMTWQGYPEGVVRLYVNGDRLGEKAYDSRFDRGDDLPSSISIGLRPSSWTGEIIHKEDGATKELRPDSLMWIGEGGLEIKDLRLYRRALNPEEILERAKKLVEGEELEASQASNA